MTRETQTPQNQIAEIDAAWEALLTQLKSNGEHVRELNYEQSVNSRYEGYRALLAITASSYANLMCADQLNAANIADFNPVLNYGMPCPDYRYSFVHLRPGQSYRVRGVRGSAEFIDVQQQIGWYGKNEEGGTVTTVCNANVFDVCPDVKPGEEFEFILSADSQDGCWLTLEEDVDTLMIREAMIDYDRMPQITRLHFEPLQEDADVDSGSLSGKSANQVATMQAMHRAQQFLKFCLNMGASFKGENNVVRRETFGDAGGQTGQAMFQARFCLEQDQALVIEWKVNSDWQYWSMCLGDDYWSSLEFTQHQINLNHRMATPDHDGILRVVISRDDPGVRNWLATCDHRAGILLIRARSGLEIPLPVATVVPVEELSRVLPPETAMVSHNDRRQTLKNRRRHFQLIYG